MADFGTTLASTAIKTASGPATSALTRWGTRKYDKFIANYTNYLSEYVDDSIMQCSSVTNILYRNQSAVTSEKYVHVSFKRGKDSHTDESLIAALTGGRRLLVRGRGGAGKTMFTKWAVLRMVENTLQHQKIPLFIELRDLSLSDPQLSLEELIFRHASSNRQRTNFNQFLEGVKAGMFVLVLDAADEVRKDSRGIILKRINEFARTFPETGILLTSRDFPQVDGISGFEEYRTVPLTQDQALDIIEKLDYKDKIKVALKSDIKEDKYRRHSFFLQNPLLVTILLLTFDQSREIPTKRSSFYKRAFEALYERHDSSKDIDFSRDQHAGLPMDEFEKVFAHFCFGTYVNSVYDFTQNRLDELIKISASETIKEGEMASNISRDAIESACLIVKEGHDLVFVHRSFQEYFAALYIKNYKESDIADLIEAALMHGHGENTLEFIYELDQRSLEKAFILPRLKKINKKIANLDLSNIDDSVNFVSLFFKSVIVYERSFNFSGIRFSDRGDSIFLFNISALYPETDVFRIFSEEGLSGSVFGMFPRESIMASRSSTLIEDKDMGTRVRISFSSTAREWFADTEIPGRVLHFARGLQELEKRLESAYSKDVKAPMSRFDAFSSD